MKWSPAKGNVRLRRVLQITGVAGLFFVATISSFFLSTKPAYADVVGTGSLRNTFLICSNPGSIASGTAPDNSKLKQVHLENADKTIDKTDTTSAGGFYTVSNGQFTFTNLPSGSFSYNVSYQDGTTTYTGSGSNISVTNGQVTTISQAGVCLQPSATPAAATEEQAPKSDFDCTLGPMGWVLCPVIRGISHVNDAAYALIQNMLVIEPVTVDNQGPLHEVWVLFRNFANILFVIGFLVVIYSQATGAGISAYGIKKLFPRIIMAAILVNISFFICQVALDLSNVIGVSLHDLLENIVNARGFDIKGNLWESLVTVILGAGGVVGGVSIVIGAGTAGAAGALLLPIAVIALFAVVTTVFVLIARQALIVLLVAISPLAFVALILPNTEKLFDKWKDLFFTMLLMFPLISLLFGGTKLASWIILSADTGPEGTSAIMALTGVAVLFIPLFGVPLLLKFAGGFLGRLGAYVNDRNKGPFDRMRKAAEGRRDLALHKAGIRNANKPSKLIARDPDEKTFSKKAFKRAGSNFARRSFTYGGRAHAKLERDAERASVKNEMDHANAFYIANRASNENPAFRQKLAGGKKAQITENGLAQAAARQWGAAIAQRNSLIEQDNKAAAAIISDFGFTDAQMKNLYMDGLATNEAGKTLNGDLFQKAAQARMVTEGRIGVVHDMLLNANMSQEVREALANNIEASYPVQKGKGHQLNYDQIRSDLIAGRKVEQKTIYEGAVKLLPTLNRDQMSTQDAVSIKALTEGLKLDPGNTTVINKTITLAKETMSDANLRKNFNADSKAAMEQLIKQYDAGWVSPLDP